MKGLSKEEMTFLDSFLNKEELTEDGMKDLDRHLKNPEFKLQYQKRLDEKYNVGLFHSVMAYLPMILMIALVVLGIYFIITK